MKCPSCGAENIEGAAFCDNCGAGLLAASAQAAPAASSPLSPSAPSNPPLGAPAPQDPSLGTPRPTPVSLPVVNPVITTPVSPEGGPNQSAPAASLAPAAGPRLKLVIAGTNQPFELQGKQEYLLGRLDPISGITPDIDLTPHGGDEAGVSRRHCKLSIADTQCFVEDLNSTNFTLINKQRVQPGARQLLQAGDQLQLGKLTMNFFIT